MGPCRGQSNNKLPMVQAFLEILGHLLLCLSCSAVVFLGSPGQPGRDCAFELAALAVVQEATTVTGGGRVGGGGH